MRISVSSPSRRSVRSVRTGALAVPALLAAAALTSGLACGDSEARACRIGADCASGMCGEDGICVAGPATPDGSTGAPDGSSTEGDAGTASPDGGDVALPGCTPNQDGTITREEIPIGAGLHASFRIAADVDVSSAGTPDVGETRTWDLSGALIGDATVAVETLPLAGAWYGPSYPNATYATRLRNDSDLLGVFEAGPSALTLRGVASPQGGVGRTELSYAPPVEMLQFPLTLGKTWSTTATVTGTAQNITYVAGFNSYTEKYDAKVDAAGKLVTPLGTFEVLRVKVELKRTYGAIITTSRTFVFVSECYGNVASIASADNDPSAELTHAAEVRRIAP